MRVDRLPLRVHTPAPFCPELSFVSFVAQGAHRMLHPRGTENSTFPRIRQRPWPGQWDAGSMDSMAWLILWPLEQKDARLSQPGLLAWHSIPNMMLVFLQGGPGSSGYQANMLYLETLACPALPDWTSSVVRGFPEGGPDPGQDAWARGLCGMWHSGGPTLRTWLPC